MKNRLRSMRYATLAILLVLIMVFSACTGTPSGNSTTDSTSTTDSSSSTTDSSSDSSSTPVEPEVKDTGFDSDHNWVGPVTELTFTGVEAGGTFQDYRDLPIPKLLEQKTGVRLNWEQVTTEKWELQMAAGEFSDIFRIGSSDVKTSSTLAQGGYLYDFEDLLQEWGPNLRENMAKQLEVSKAVHGGMYIIPTNTGPGAMLYYPMLKWTPYKEAGFPEIKDMDSLIDALTKMVEVSPTTKDGKKVYAFSSFIDWGSTFLFYYPWNSALGYDNISTFYLADHKTMEIVSQLDNDDRSVFWWTTELMYKLNQRGLFDPDTFTQTWEEMVEKRKAEQVLFAHGFWDRPNLFNAENELLDTFFPIPWEGGSVQGGAFNYLFEFGQAISSKCQSPEAAIRLFDYCASYDGAELLYNGIEGEDWNLVDNVPMPSDSIIADRKAGVDLSKTRGFDYGGANFLIGISTLYQDPRYNVSIDFKSNPAVQRMAYNDLENEVIEHFGVGSINEIIFDAISSGSQGDMSNFNTLVSKQMPSMPNNITRINTDIQQLAATEWGPRIVLAANDAEFQSLKLAAIEEFKQAGLDELTEWVTTNWAESIVKAEAFN